MGTLAIATAQRWFPEGSAHHPVEEDPNAQANSDNPILKMIMTTSLLGFEAGARALQSYDLIADGLLQSKAKTLLLAGEKDAGGAIAKGLMQLQVDWQKQGGDVDFAEVGGAGHLPMVDKAEEWVEVISSFLET
jgi:pimeloyl-ACP methyl ester carboxylesterase